MHVSFSLISCVRLRLCLCVFLFCSMRSLALNLAVKIETNKLMRAHHKQMNVIIKQQQKQSVRSQNHLHWQQQHTMQTDKNKWHFRHENLWWCFYTADKTPFANHCHQFSFSLWFAHEHSQFSTVQFSVFCVAILFLALLFLSYDLVAHGMSF